MPTAASQIFDFLEQHESVTVDRHEIAFAAFGTLRRSVRQVVVRLRDAGEQDQEALEISDRLRTLLSEWLTVPVPFDEAMHDALETLLGNADAVEARWGEVVRSLYDAALGAACALPADENPVRKWLREVVRRLRSQGRTFKIYCHRRARPHFESLLMPPGDSPLSNDAFLHSVRDYRETQPFDVLIKVGPLRARGWGSAPDALRSAPRFSTLAQVVWSGCGDEPDFGYDPAAAPTDLASVDEASPEGGPGGHSALENWAVHVTCSGEDPGPDVVDELRVFREMNESREKRPAKLVQVDAEHGILYPPHSQVLSFDPDPAATQPLRRRTPGETLTEGMFLISPLIDDVDLGEVRAEHGHYSQIWKSRLKQEWERNHLDLIGRLKDAGLNLVHLADAIRHWLKPPSTVIHAPQQIRHFEILLRILRFDEAVSLNSRQRRADPWQLAWNEVRRSRGEAIQAGVQEQEIVERRLLEILRGLVPQIREQARENEGFHLTIPAENEVKGGFLFFKVLGIEEGFSAPEAELRVVRELATIDQWRD